MPNSLFTKNNLFNFTKSSLVLYVEDSYNPEANNFIQANYKQIVEIFNAKNIDFCYLPYMLQSESYQAVVQYNRPYLQSIDESILTADIYTQIISRQSKKIRNTGLLLFNNSYGNDVVLSFTIDKNNTLQKQFQKIANVIFSVSRSIAKIDMRNHMAYFPLGDSYERDDNTCSHTVHEKNTDSEFDIEDYRLADEIRTRILQLKETNALSLIGDILEDILGVSKQLSKIFITNDYRIFLKDYGMKEVQMAPLPKSVFILFLRHPEGILFKELSDYHDELLSIYRNITVHENIDRCKESISAMTDPLNNSINEKCSRIRTAFLELIADDLAQQYYVTGKRGEPKTIQLDRSLVEFQ